MSDQPNYDKLLHPIADVNTSIESLLHGAFGKLMGDQREGLKRIYATSWGLHTLFLEIVTNIGIDNIARRAYLPKKFDEYITPMVEDSLSLMQGMDGPLTDEQRVAVEFIHVTGNLLRRYVDNLWLYSQLAHDLYHIDKQPVPVEAIVDPMKWSTTESLVDLELLVPEDLPLIRVDATLMQAAIMQIVENSINNTQEGSIRVEVSTEDDTMVITVIDTGCGIPEAMHQHIFKPFFQVDRDKLGLGLGLPIAQKSLLLHQGLVQINAMMNRTTAVIRFPV